MMDFDSSIHIVKLDIGSAASDFTAQVVAYKAVMLMQTKIV
jgi:hypothetical protein